MKSKHTSPKKYTNWAKLIIRADTYKFQLKTTIIIAKRGKVVQSCALDPTLYLSSVEKSQISHSKNCNSKHTSTLIPLVYCKMQFSSRLLFSQAVTHKTCIVRLEYIQDVEKWLKVLDFTKITRFIESKNKSFSSIL